MKQIETYKKQGDSMVSLLVIADDFTGALDTGVKFASGGARVRVVTDYEYAFDQVSNQVQVLVMDAETRHLSSEGAYERVFHIVKQARTAGIPFIYKKTDSALRGNIGSELSAVLAATEGQVLHFLPAFPKMGRTTVSGVHYIDGVPVHDSVFGKDPFEPVKCSDIQEVIARQSDTRTCVISDGQVLKNPKEPTIAVYDARTDEELQTIAAALKQSGGLEILAGCAGMAETLPQLLGLEGAKLPIPEFEPGLLVACGSVNPITKGQLDYAAQHGFERIRLTPEQKLEPGYFETEGGKVLVEALVSRVRNTAFVILDTNDAPAGPDTLVYAESHGIALDDLRVRITAALGYLVKRLVEAGVRHTMLITGGDSLLGFMNQIQVYEIMPVCEMMPGTVLSRFEIGGRTYEILSKSGGFGGEDLMVKLKEQIMGNRRRERDAG